MTSAPKLDNLHGDKEGDWHQVGVQHPEGQKGDDDPCHACVVALHVDVKGEVRAQDADCGLPVLWGNVGCAATWIDDDGDDGDDNNDIEAARILKQV